MPRTTSDAVSGLLGDDYAAGRSLTAFIASAGRLVDRVAACATARGLTLSADDAADLETWLAAHLYQQSDPGYTSKSTVSASGSFKGETGTGLRSTNYGATALALDPTGGCLAAVTAPARPGGFYGGVPPADRETYRALDGYGG